MRLFVYGSMSEGLVHYPLIQNFIQSSKQAFIKGAAYRLKVGYPVVLDEGDDLIPGSLLEIKNSDLLLQLMDQFHGVNAMDPSASMHFRKEIPVVLADYENVTTANSENLMTMVYFLNSMKLPGGAQLIVGGDWRRSMQEQAPLVQTLSDRHINYVKELGKAKGRETVPIRDMSIYRDLIRLEIIDDKGRRLKLSKLGHELSRYLT